MNVVDRLMRTAWRLVLLLLIVAMVLPMAARVAGSLISSAVHGIAAAVGNAASGVVGSFLVVAFVVGLGVRLSNWIRGRNPAAARARETDARRTRLAVRRPGEDVPLGVPLAEPPEDADPPLPGPGE